jgi:hypothetical protein
MFDRESPEQTVIAVCERNGWTGGSYVGDIIIRSLDHPDGPVHGVEVTPVELHLTLAYAYRFREVSDSRDPPASDFIQWLRDQQVKAASAHCVYCQWDGNTEVSQDRFTECPRCGNMGAIPDDLGDSGGGDA